MAKESLTKLRVAVVGVPALKRRLKASQGRVEAATKAALYQMGEKIMTAAKRQTPVDTGSLRASGHVSLPFKSGNSIFVELGFGGPAGSGNHGNDTNAETVGYALLVHEDLKAKHPVGKAKYLEDPVKEHLREVKQKVDMAVKRALRSRL